MLTNLPTFRFDSSLQKRKKQGKSCLFQQYFERIQTIVPNFGRFCLLRTVIYNKLCYLCFLSCILNVYSQNLLSYSMRWNIGFSRNILKTSQYRIAKFIANLQNLDSDLQKFHFEWTLFNGKRKYHIGNRSDFKKINSRKS